MTEADRIMRNFASSGSFTTTVPLTVLEEIIENYSIDFFFCRGIGRKIIVQKLTDNYFSLKSKAV